MIVEQAVVLIAAASGLLCVLVFVVA